MADGSIKSRIAALNLEEVHTPLPGAKPAYTYDAATIKKKPPPPPPPSARPPAYSRQSVNNPPILSNAPTSARQLGNQPVAASEAPTSKISPALPPRVPPRNGTTPRQTPALPPRKPSEHHTVTRRESSESISTIASGISTLSLGSVKTNGTAHSNASTGTLHHIRAPAFDPTKLPPLPPKKAPEDTKKSSATLSAMKSKRDTVPARALPPQLKTPGKFSRPISRPERMRPCYPSTSRKVNQLQSLRLQQHSRLQVWQESILTMVVYRLASASVLASQAISASRAITQASSSPATEAAV